MKPSALTRVALRSTLALWAFIIISLGICYAVNPTATLHELYAQVNHR